MNKLCEIITSLAVFALVLSFCTIDSNLIDSLVIMVISGAWLVGYGVVYEEKRRERERW